MSALQIYLLGPLEIRSGAHSLAKPATAKSQSLLAYLALHRNSIHYREQLASLLWDAWPASKARRSLSTALWHIRRCLPDESYISGGLDTVQFTSAADVWLDVEEFLKGVEAGDAEGLQTAVSLYRADFLHGFYDEWVISERYRFENLYCEALSSLMSLRMRKEKYHEAVAISLRLLELDPLREEAYRLSMRAYSFLGQRNKALRQYQRCREAVSGALGVEPMVETTKLYRSILRGDYPSDEKTILSSPVKVEITAPVPAGRSPLDAITVSRLVGRDQELAFLQDCWRKSMTGAGGIVLVRGEAGVGKTRLIEEFANRLRRKGHRVLWGRCYDFERILPYQPFVEALQAVVPTMTNAEMADLPLWTLQALAGLLPDIFEKIATLPDSITPQPDQAQRRLFEAVAHLVGSLSSRGAILLVLEDLHWANTSSLQLLHYLLRALVEQPVLVVGTLRSGIVAGQQPLLNLQERLRHDRLVRSLILPRLARKHVETLLIEMSGAGETVLPLARKLYQDTEGNPFFLIEIVKSLFDSGKIFMENGIWAGDFSQIRQGKLPLPAGISETVLFRVRALDEDSREVVRLAAVIGSEFDFDLLNAAWGHDEESILKRLDELLQRRLIAEASLTVGRDYIFTHHKIQEVVYSSIPRRHRQQMHARVGKAFEDLYNSQIEKVTGELAYHFENCRSLNEVCSEKAISYLIMAGDHARGLYAFSEAIDYYQRALEILRDGEQDERTARTLMKLGLTYHTAFDFDRSRQAYQEGFALWQRYRISEAAALPPPQTLRLGGGNPLTLDPALAQDSGAFLILDQLFSRLITLGPEMETLPEVAASWEITHGGSRYIFHLRDDVVWSDGTPVTAADFEFAWKRILDPAMKSPAAILLYDIRGAQAFHQGQSTDPDSVALQCPDDHTLLVDLEGPAGYFLYLLGNSITYPVPRHVVELHGERWTEVEHIVTNGPFKLMSWERDHSISLARNPLFHGQFKGNVHQIEYFVGLEPSRSLAFYEQDKLDLALLWGTVMHETTRRSAANPFYANELVSLPVYATEYMGFDVSRPPFNDRRVRRAFVMAIDRGWWANEVKGGWHSPATGGYIPPGIPGHSPAIGLPYDPVRARQLLAEAGYPNGDGFPPITQVGPIPQSEWYLRLEQLPQRWKSVLGVEIADEVMRWGAYIDRLRTQTPNIFYLGWEADYPDPDNFLRLGIFSYTRGIWRNEAYVRLVEQARRILDQEKRMELYQKADRILIEEAAILPLSYMRYHMLKKPWVNKYPLSPQKSSYWKDVIIEPH